MQLFFPVRILPSKLSRVTNKELVLKFNQNKIIAQLLKPILKLWKEPQKISGPSHYFILVQLLRFDTLQFLRKFPFQFSYSKSLDGQNRSPFLYNCFVDGRGHLGKSWPRWPHNKFALTLQILGLLRNYRTKNI